jgi:TM2 domain-containing membrane protein YozV
MLKYSIFILFYILFSLDIFAQDIGDSISVLKNELESFKYSQVIDNANFMILNNKGLPNAALVEIYRLKATAQFSLSDIEGAKATFINIFELDTNYTLDSSNTSPKIINYFNGLKHNYLIELSRQKQNLKIKTDTVFIQEGNSYLSLKQAVIRSMIFPGLGHFYLGQNIKGIILSSLTVITLSSMLYFIIDSNNKESNYLNAEDNVIIQSRYNEYNTSYKLRNISIFSVAAVWLYSQVDLLFFSSNSPGLLTGSVSNPTGGMQLTFNFAF